MKSAEHYAELLRKAAEDKIGIEPLRDSIGAEDADFAYKIQQVNTQFQLDAGKRIVGKKIGLTSKVVQDTFNVYEPDFGILFNHMEILNNDSISIQHIMQGKVEAEIALVLKEDLNHADISMHELISAVDYALPSIEIVGSRINNWNIKISDTIADNASASHFVLGHTPKRLTAFDIVNTKMEMSLNGEVLSTGTGAACLGSPLNSALWLANKMVEMGSSLKKGEIILTGALGKFLDIKAGDYVEAKFSGLGEVAFHISE